MKKIICRTVDDLDDMYNKCKEAKLFSIDTETVSLEDKTMIGFSVATDNYSWYVSMDYFKNNEYVSYMQKLGEDENLIKVFHNAKFDLQVFKKKDIYFKRFYDSMVMAWLVDTGRRFTFGLKQLAKDILGVDMTKFKDVSPDDFDKFADYAMDDTIYTLQLFNYYKQKLSKVLKADLLDYEMPCVEMLSEMEEYGVAVNVSKLRSLKVKLEKDLKSLKLKIIQETVDNGFVPQIKSAKKGAKLVFNPASPQQVKDYLHHIGIMVESTGVKELKKHKKNKWIKMLLEHRKKNKLYTSFVKNLLPKIEKNGGRLYGQFKQTGTQTGRFSSASPNLQQIPNEQNFREMFIPSEGYKLIVADYSQMESRVLAHFSKDKRMIQFFKDGHDLHSATAHGMFKLDCNVDEVKDKYPDERFQAKSINFGLAYGRGAKSLGEQIGLSERKAQKIIDLYFEQFPSVRGYIQRVQHKAKREGCVKTLFGRLRHFPDLHNLNNSGKSFYQIMGEVSRRSINTKIQGSSADIMKKAMIDLYRIIKERNDGAHILIQVHDEIVMEAPEEYGDDYRVILQNCMENAVKLRVPLIAEAKVCNNWMEGK